MADDVFDLLMRTNALSERVAALERQEQTLAPVYAARLTHAENQLTTIAFDVLVSHFETDTGLPAGWSWASDAVFGGAPDNVSYSQINHWLFAYQNTSTKRGLAFRSIAKGNRLSARISVTVLGSAGLRVDDGTDNNYYEVYARHLSGATFDLRERYRTGGGAVTTNTITSVFGALSVPNAIYMTTGATWSLYSYLITPTKNLIGLTLLSGLTWTPSRGGVLINPDQNAGAGWVDWVGIGTP